MDNIDDLKLELKKSINELVDDSKKTESYKEKILRKMLSIIKIVEDKNE